jgi:hypothetical protein
MAGEAVKERMNLLLQEKQKQARLSKLRTDTLRRIDFIKHKAIIEFHEVYQVVREFFKEFLEKRYEFTMSELRSELKKVYISNSTRQDIARFFEELEGSEYASVHYPREDLVMLLEKFRQIVEQLVRVHTVSKTFFERMRSFFLKEQDPQTIIAELPVVEGADAYHVRIYTLIERCYIALDKHNLRGAKSAYDALLAEYNQLDGELQQQYFEIIEQTYHDLQHRAKMQP